MLLAYVGMMIVLFAAADTLKPRLIDLTARCTASLLTLLGGGAHAAGSLVTSHYGTVEIIYECTGIFPIVILAAAIIAFPAGWRSKAIGLSLGIPIILVLNQVRVLSLVFIERFVPAIMGPVHHLIWPAMILFSTTVLFLFWAKTALNGRQG